MVQVFKKTKCKYVRDDTKRLTFDVVVKEEYTVKQKRQLGKEAKTTGAKDQQKQDANEKQSLNDPFETKTGTTAVKRQELPN